MFKQLFDILRRLFSRSGQAVIDKNIVPLMEQQIEDTKTKIRDSEKELVKITAARNLAQTDRANLQATLKELEGNLTTLLARPKEAQDTALAQRLATKFAEQEKALERLDADIAAKEQTIAKTKEAINNAKSKLTDFENRKDSVEANAALIAATQSISQANAGANSSLNDLAESLDRTEQLQRQTMAQIDAAQEMEDESSGKSLDEELVKAGLKTGGAASAESVLARFAPKSETTPQA